jgi:hypothetical protein
VIKRRDFVILLGGAAAAWPIAARAQQAAMAVIGFLHLTSRDETRGYLPDFHRGLAEVGYVEGKNVAIEYRWGEGHNDRMPSLIAECVRRGAFVRPYASGTVPCHPIILPMSACRPITLTSAASHPESRTIQLTSALRPCRYRRQRRADV